jgi:hypothetical protein
MEILKIGQVLYSKDLNEYEVIKIGNKYFECKNHRGRFSKETLKYDTEYSNKTQLYVNKQCILDEKEIYKLQSEIRSKITQYGNMSLSLTSLRKIIEIINND